MRRQDCTASLTFVPVGGKLLTSSGRKRDTDYSTGQNGIGPGHKVTCQLVMSRSSCYAWLLLCDLTLRPLCVHTNPPPPPPSLHLISSLLVTATLWTSTKALAGHAVPRQCRSHKFISMGCFIYRTIKATALRCLQADQLENLYNCS